MDTTTRDYNFVIFSINELCRSGTFYAAPPTRQNDTQHRAIQNWTIRRRNQDKNKDRI